MKWEDKTDVFDDKEWHGRYLIISEVYDNKLEVNLYSIEEDNKYEIYVGYGIMFGMISVEKENAESLREEIKKVILEDYLKEKDTEHDYSLPSDEFMDKFIKKYQLYLPMDLI